MADPKATASYKKQVGTVAVSNGKKALLWTPSTSSDGQPTFRIAVGTITSMFILAGQTSSHTLYGR
jgi:hypothetical protein